MEGKKKRALVCVVPQTVCDKNLTWWFCCFAVVQATQRETIGSISEMFGAAATAKGLYVAPGRKPGAGQRKLYLLIEGTSQIAVKQARVSSFFCVGCPPLFLRKGQALTPCTLTHTHLAQAELVRILEETTRTVGFDKGMYAKYQVL